MSNYKKIIIEKSRPLSYFVTIHIFFAATVLSPLIPLMKIDFGIFLCLWAALVLAAVITRALAKSYAGIPVPEPIFNEILLGDESITLVSNKRFKVENIREILKENIKKFTLTVNVKAMDELRNKKVKHYWGYVYYYSINILLNNTDEDICIEFYKKTGYGPMASRVLTRFLKMQNEFPNFCLEILGKDHSGYADCIRDRIAGKPLGLKRAFLTFYRDYMYIIDLSSLLLIFFIL